MGKHKYKILSLFTGAGGLDIGFELTGKYQTHLAVESEPVFCETLRENQKRGYLKAATIIHDLVEHVSPNYLRSRGFNGEPCDGIIGGPPCQSFSAIGNRKGVEDPRGMQIFQFARLVSEHVPRFFVMENVPPLERVNGGAVIEELERTFKSSGYKTRRKVLCSADYGSPTIRKRLFIVGIRGADFEFPAKSHTDPTELRIEGVRDWVSVGDALKGLPLAALKPPGEPQGHFVVNHCEEVKERFNRLRPGQKDYIRKRTRLDITRPSVSMIAGTLSGVRSHIHPSLPRELTLRECARIHGFSDDFVFCGNHAAVGKQIANSVPIALSRSIASALSEALRLT